MSSRNSEPTPGAASVASPCCRRCCLDALDVCLGCGRSLEEILQWSESDDARRRQIVDAAADRLRNRQP
ncbi:hypothetical protein SAMN05216287_0492 [Pseudomonas kuykendallii]|uniref:DUF1289 domain-containing protein n=1 Tax=Pseudomonas kuykendallii TaxID=1007099 RepID=A0A1H2S0H7_9PSED|nr:DUF1289 domain-containing protein [Pseudomonas kuykendallii]SDW24419.1 hypothetical protein SAMN05216287_0492 [Pseudomonas kuykendallii]